MNGPLQAKISPPEVRGNMNVSDAQVAKKAIVKDSTEEQKVDFRDLMYTSNSDLKAIHNAAKNGDLSAATDQKDFLAALSDQTKKMRTPKNTLDKDDFLKLFVSQMQNQDPMNPKDGSEMASQLAQFNGLEQMMNLNKGMDNLNKTQTSNRSVNLVEYIGKEVSLVGGKLKLDQGKLSDVQFSLKTIANNVQLRVRNSAGVVIAENDLGNFNAGEHKLEWDGKTQKGQPVTDGMYDFELVGRGSDGQEFPIEVSTKAKVTGVDMTEKDGGLYTDLGKVTIEKIKSIGVAGFSVVDLKSKEVAKKTDEKSVADIQKQEKPESSDARVSVTPTLDATAATETKKAADTPVIPLPETVIVPPVGETPQTRVQDFSNNEIGSLTNPSFASRVPVQSPQPQ